jgi:hypothetical protein
VNRFLFGRIPAGRVIRYISVAQRMPLLPLAHSRFGTLFFTAEFARRKAQKGFEKFTPKSLCAFATFAVYHEYHL